MAAPLSAKPIFKTAAAVTVAGAIAFAPLVPALAEVAASQDPIAISVGSNTGFTRVEFAGVIGARTQVRQEGRQVIARVGSTAAPDIARLRVDPPPGVESVTTRPARGGTEVVFTLTEAGSLRTGSSDGVIWLNFFPGAAPGDSPAESSAALARVPVRTEVAEDQLTLRIEWPQATGAAVFRRGEAVWLVFDAAARFDMSGSRALGPVANARAASGPDYSVIRLAAPNNARVAAVAEGSTWIVTVGGADAPAGGVSVARDDAAAPALTAHVAGAGRVIWLTDPMAGDRFAAVTARGPAKGLETERRLVDLNLLPTAQGLALDAAAGDLQVAVAGDLVRIGRPGEGLRLSPPSDSLETASAAADAPRRAQYPALILAEWGAVGHDGFKTRLNNLRTAADAETLRAKDDPRAPLEARLALARFLVGSELSYEAIGVLNALIADAPGAQGEPEVRGLRGAARAAIGRHDEAAVDLAGGGLSSDPSAQAWQGLLAAERSDWAAARIAFGKAAPAIDQFPPLWRVRFAAAHARAAMETGDINAAHGLLAYAFRQEVPASEELRARLVQAAVFERQGQTERALRVYQAVARAPIDDIAAKARLSATRLELALNRITPAQATEKLEPLRWLWRGDATELEVIRTLAGIYLQQGRYREALGALKGAGTRLPNLPEAAALQADLSNAFRALFLEGAADGLQPVQSLALFYDFRELTPVGADGDEMVRRLARRLIDVDLLDQAAELLKHQVDERLEGVAKAQVATDLAAVYLMDRQPEPALQALWNSRSTLLPTALQSQRRVLEARALMDLGRYDHALEILGSDTGASAQAVRGEIAWKQQNWAQAAAFYDARLGRRAADTATPLSAEEESFVIRAAVGYSLAQDDARLGRMARDYAPFIDRSRAPDILRVALEGPDSPSQLAAVQGAVARADTFSGWVRSMKTELRARLDGDTGGQGSAQSERGGANASASATAPSNTRAAA